MLTIRKLDPVQSVPALWGLPPSAGWSPIGWEYFCQRLGILAFVAEGEDGGMAGFAVAESHPHLVQILNLEGNTDACRALLERLVRLAGERNMNCWCPTARRDVQSMLEARAFARLYEGEFQDRPSLMYRFERSEENPDDLDLA